MASIRTIPSLGSVDWMAADRVYPGRSPFRAYAVLGDDVVIGDRKVAQAYAAILSDLGVTISYQKSLVSDSGRIRKEVFGQSGRPFSNIYPFTFVL